LLHTVRTTRRIFDDQYDFVAHVSAPTGDTETVRFRQRTGYRECSCKRFQDTQLPCVHAAAALRENRDNVKLGIGNVSSLSHLNANGIRISLHILIWLSCRSTSFPTFKKRTITLSTLSYLTI
jgi:hypothetical protein